MWNNSLLSGFTNGNSRVSTISNRPLHSGPMRRRKASTESRVLRVTRATRTPLALSMASSSSRPSFIETSFAASASISRMVRMASAMCSGVEASRTVKRSPSGMPEGG